jgi:hypothetical protein
MTFHYNVAVYPKPGEGYLALLRAFRVYPTTAGFSPQICLIGKTDRDFCSLTDATDWDTLQNVWWR